MNTTPLAAAKAAACLGLCHLICSSALFAQDVKKPEEKKEAVAAGESVVLEKFEVTGSRVKRVDYETVSPVVTFTAAAVEDKGYATLGEFVQSLPYNNAISNSEFTTASFVTGAATINPRGLGSNRVLSLVNGRRAVPYALTNSSSGTAQTVFNFNSIPSSAIHRIEFLKDGASAIYGSDAITGVFNMILKKNYEGSSIELTLSNTLKHDTLRKTVSIFTGLSKDGWEITAGVTLQSRNSSFIKDYGVTTTDYRYLGQKGTNMNSTIYHPSYLSLTAAQAVASGLGTAAGFYIVQGPKGVTNPTKASFTYVGTSTAVFTNDNRQDFANVTQLYPSSESGGGYASILRVINPQVSAFANFLYSRSLTHYELQPYGFTNSLAGITLPATNPYNPTGLSFTNTTTTFPYLFRGEYLPKREVTSTTMSSVAGFRGTALRVWNWETAVSFGQNETMRDTDLIAAADLQAALNGTTRATAWNPFGPSDNPDIEKNLYTRSRGLDGKIDSLSFDASVNGSFYQLPWKGAGELGLAAGYEYRRDNLSSNPEPNNFIGFTATTPFKGKRNIHSAYAELSVPVQKWVEFQLAGRHERYSDFGNTTKPKVGAKLRLPNNRFLNVVLRGSYSESFKAPDLGQLYQPQSNAVTSTSLLDPLRPQDAARQLPSRVGGNPNLKPEEGKVQYSGAVFEVPAIRGLSFSVDFFDVQITNVISSLSATYLLTAEGRRLFPNAITRDPTTDGTPGRIASIAAISNNLGLQLYRGLDYGVRYSLRNTRLGNFTFNAEITQVIKKGSDAGTGAGFFNNTGLAFDVEWRYNYGVSWSYKNFSARVAADVVGKYFNDNWTTAGWGENVFTLINPSVSYRGFRKMSVTLGVTNVFNARPPAVGFRALGFDDRVYGAGALGISAYLRLRREF
ncbi:TonB-dependent receptor domain-containing protein [Horticoccus sp. 23ND18S-11]|uniref:TonB-dependent receptor domain-containing protein n=1 Tax=Horticoccus sp. 23ND18S-11 TaxID=3391832 RepID=UPI0039C9DB76